MSTQSLYGLKIGDMVRFIGSEERHVKDIQGKEGPIINIEPKGGQFHVKFNDITYTVSFSRFDLLLLQNQPKEVVDFEGVLVDQDEMNIEQMRSYLNKYHGLVEGINYAITCRNDLDESGTEYKEVFLENESYVKLMKELISLEKSRQILGNQKVHEFYSTFRTKIVDDAISISFKVKDWTFRAHILGWQVQRYTAGFYGLDLIYEMGFRDVGEK